MSDREKALEALERLEGCAEFGAISDENYDAIIRDAETIRAALRPEGDVDLPPRPDPDKDMPDNGELLRYGVTWTEEKPNVPLLSPMRDGYWTPWHLAQQGHLRTSGPETPDGAIHNGIGFMDRLENHYKFKDEQNHSLENCHTWHEVRRCFNTLINHISNNS